MAEKPGKLESQSNATDSSFATAAPQLSLPKGGGAIRGMGEKFAANPVTGTGSLNIPIRTSPGRSGFGPQLSLSYDSGSGNGAFGFGWSPGLPSVTRKTDKGLPQYLDAFDSDVFILSSAEDLVPVYRQDPDGSWVAAHPEFHRYADGNWVRNSAGRLVIHEDELDGYRVRRYRPRIEGLFARIERWNKIGSPGDVHWRSISNDNILTLYGLDSNSRIADPLDATRIFSWLICESRDDRGNGIRYLYKPEDGAYQTQPGQANPFQQAHQLNRGLASDPRRTAQRYLQRVLYGNVEPLLDDKGQRPRYLSDLPHPPEDSDTDWLFEIRFDYGELDEADPLGHPEKPWLYRPDAFSSYRSGFEVRTCRRCERVLMVHHIPDQATQPGCEGVVGSTQCIYDDELNLSLATKPIYSFLKKVLQKGWKQEGGSITTRSLPPVEFWYTEPNVQEVVEEVEQESLENLPIGLDGNSYRWTDLHGEGLPGILTEQAGAWYYKRNWSPIPTRLSDGSTAVKASFAPLETVALMPNVAVAAGAEIMDLAADGRPDVVLLDAPIPGFYEHDQAEGWQPFRPFPSRLNRNLHDPNVKFVDLDGDGRADVLITEDDAFVWHLSLAEEGFGPARRIVQAFDEEKGPRIVFADGTESIYLADLSGDGLSDIVRIRNGEVCYWPNLGYCRFGARITMDDAPWFDNQDQFDNNRVRLADIDGSGTTDIIYLHRDGVRLYFNQSGNSWRQPKMLTVFPRIDELASIVPIDLLGNGTACLVWSSSLQGDARSPMRYINLMGRNKPHLLVRTVNNLGAETNVEYAPSTRFYLLDKMAGRPWITRLPFPVHVVERVKTYDHLSRNRFLTRYAYHHGHFDPVEREFRGFGMVEQWDTERFAALVDSNVPADNIAAPSHVPPVHTKTWFHTGIYLGRQRVSRHYEDEYFREDGLTIETARPLLLDDTIIPPGLTLEEEREACRALKGSMLRQEVYADDAEQPGASPEQVRRARTPYTVTEQNFTIRALQSRDTNRHAVFFTHAHEAISYHYERNPADPRIQHALTLEVDAFGNVLKQAAIGYGRRAQIRVDDGKGNVQMVPNPGFSGLLVSDQAKQTLPLLTYTENDVTNAIESTDTHRNPLPCEGVSFELTGYTATGAAGRFQASDFVEPDPARAGRLKLKFVSPDVAYEGIATGNQRRRPIEWQRTLYRRDDLSGLSPLGTVQSLALPGESYKRAFTPGLLQLVYQRNGTDLLGGNPNTLLAGGGSNRGGYVDLDNDQHWWLPSGSTYFSPGSGDDVPTELAYARKHFFLPCRYRDPFYTNAWNTESVVSFDDYDLLPTQTTDALGNTARAIHDYRVLQPQTLIDPNGNRSQAAFDALGLVVAAAVQGKVAPAPAEGDLLEGFDPDPDPATLQQFLLDPLGQAAGLLGKATTRVVYDLDSFRRTQQANPNDSTKWQPAFAATLARETHVNSPLPPQGLKIQLSISYSDGFGREIQKKMQAEAGPVPKRDPNGKIVVGADGQPVMTANNVNPRWVGSSWTVFNNKEKPVRKYEPFFTDTHQFEFDIRIGVSPVLFYDPAERVVATLHPNHTYEKVVFDPWRQVSWDVNDTVAQDDPGADPDVGDFFKRLPATDYSPTWRVNAAGSSDKWLQDAATKAAAHANTPTIAHFDTLGRTFLTIAQNRVVCPNHKLDGTEDAFATRVELDIEGNQRAVRDERKLPVNYLPAGAIEQRVVMQYDYDMHGNRIHQSSMEAGERWMVNDVSGKPIRAWDSRGHNFTTAYDALRRPIEQYVRGTFKDPDPMKPNSDPRTLNPSDVRGLLVDKIEYGEPPLNATAAQEQEAQRLNLRSRVYRHSDSAGVVTNARLDAKSKPTEAYDFKGNLLHSTRQLVIDYTAIPDWLNSPQLDDTESFESSTRYDALNRSIQSIAPRSSVGRGKFNVIQPAFNEANLLERVDVWLERATEPTALLDASVEQASAVGVDNIDCNAKGQRLRIDFKSNSSTFYSYDPLTFRLIQLQTRRSAADFPGDDPQPPADGWPGEQVQNLRYTYDPAGNITHIEDDAQQTIYFSNQRVEPSNDYSYDALYRLIQAKGREHLGQAGVPIPHSSNDAGRVGLLSANPPGRFAPNDHGAMGTYTEQYLYDAVGNFLQMQHARSDASVSGWTRRYTYGEASLIEGGKQSNRLSNTQVGNGVASAPETYLHDAHGNMFRMPHLGDGSPGPNMTWDYKDRLLQANLGGGGTAWYVYDASGQRVRKVWEKNKGALIEERLYLGGFEIYRTHQAASVSAISADSATLERETLHVMDDKQRIALVETRTLDTNRTDKAPEQLIRYQFGNHLGSAILELDEESQIISYEEYSPYGSSTYQAVRSQTETAKRYRYTGMERDEESGLYYHGARYYAPWLGRWVSCDPIGVSGGIDLYRYASCSPIILFDTSGLAPNRRKEPVGARKTYGDFGNAQRDRYGNRTSEDEHMHERVLQERTMKPQGSKVELVTQQNYEKQSATRQPTDAAKIKTSEAMKLRDQLDAADPSKPISDDLAKQVRPENSADRGIRARDLAIEERKAEGKSTARLEKMTNEKYYEATHDQLGDIHQQRQDYPVPNAVKRATRADIDKAVGALEEGTARSGPFIKGSGPSPTAEPGLGVTLKSFGANFVAGIIYSVSFERRQAKIAEVQAKRLEEITQMEMLGMGGEGFIPVKDPSDPRGVRWEVEYRTRIPQALVDYLMGMHLIPLLNDAASGRNIDQS